MTRIIAVTSGKGGVGKTHLSVNLALQCARAGLRTCLFDTDSLLINANLLPDLALRHGVDNAIAGVCHLRDTRGASQGIDIIPFAAELDKAGSEGLTDAAKRHLGDVFRTLAQYDLVLIDTASGIGHDELVIAEAAPEILLVITPEPNALTEAYALVKQLQRRRYAGRIQVVVNHTQSEYQARHTYEKFREVVRVYQGIDLPLLGAMPASPAILSSDAQMRVSLLSPDSSAGIALAELADHLVNTAPAPTEVDALAAFCQRLTGIELPMTYAPAPAPVQSPPPTPPTATVQTPVRTEPAAPSVPAGLAERLDKLETGLAAVLQTLQAQAADVSTPPPAEYGAVPEAEPRVQPSPDKPNHGRRAGEATAPARFVRSAQRATPIDALQLRRVVGRMLVKAMPPAADAAQEPVQIAVDQIQLEASNDFSLRPGRYTRISLHCRHIQSPDSFIEEIFTTCAITGCKVRHLGSQVRYWLTSGRDGCILLDGDDGDRNCVQVYMAAGGNNLLEAMLPDAEDIPALRKAWQGGSETAVAPAMLLGKFPHQQVRVQTAEGEDLDMFRLLRRDREPLLCAFHDAGGESIAGTWLEQSP